MDLRTAFPVVVSSPEFGSWTCIARRVSSGGIFLETFDPLPLGSEVKIHFEVPDSLGEVVAVGVVRSRSSLNYAQGGEPCALSGMGVRVSDFGGGEKDDTQARRVLH